jgi:hypothetical protein
LLLINYSKVNQKWTLENNGIQSSPYSSFPNNIFFIFSNSILDVYMDSRTKFNWWNSRTFYIIYTRFENFFFAEFIYYDVILGLWIFFKILTLFLIDLKKDIKNNKNWESQSKIAENMISLNRGKTWLSHRTHNILLFVSVGFWVFHNLFSNI